MATVSEFVHWLACAASWLLQFALLIVFGNDCLTAIAELLSHTFGLCV